MKINYTVIIKIIMLSWMLLVVGCSGEERNTKKFSIVATTSMIADAARQIAGDSAEVIALMGPGVDPHLYKPSQGDLENLMAADLILFNGLHLEGKMQDVLIKLAKKKAVVAVTKDIDPERLLYLGEPKRTPDPHIWFDVSLWKEAVKTISQSMKEKDPSRSLHYRQRTTSYLETLDSLHKEVKASIGTIPPQQRILVTAHDAFSYFGNAYDIEVRGLQGISTLSEYGLQDISRLADFLAQQKIKAVFIESSVSPKSLEAVVEGVQQRGHSINIGGSLFSDAMGEAGTPEGTYTGMVRHNVSTITEALK